MGTPRLKRDWSLFLALWLFSVGSAYFGYRAGAKAERAEHLSCYETRQKLACMLDELTPIILIYDADWKLPAGWPSCDPVVDHSE